MPWIARFRHIPRGGRCKAVRARAVGRRRSRPTAHARGARSAARTQQVVHGELVELLEGHAARGGRLHVEVLEGTAVREQRLQAVRRRLLRQLVQTRGTQRLLDLRVGTEGGRTLLEDEVVAHAARGRRPYTVEVLGARWLEVEVLGAGVAGALQEVDEPEGGPQVARAEAEVLVVLDAGLAVEVDVEELARPQGLRDAVREVQPGHLLMADLGVHAVQLGASRGSVDAQAWPTGGRRV